MSKQLIRSEKDLRGFFFDVRKMPEKIKTGVMVTTAVRKEVLTSIDQGKMILEGRVVMIKFDNLSGGVYRAYILDQVGPCQKS